jgi:hypothetical protein
VREKRLEAKSGQDVVYRDPSAFTWWGVTLVFNVVFIVQHQANYPSSPNPGLYGFLIFGINLPWTLSCVRGYIRVADTPGTRAFAIAYDTLVTKPFFRNQVGFLFVHPGGRLIFKHAVQQWFLPVWSPKTKTHIIVI